MASCSAGAVDADWPFDVGVVTDFGELERLAPEWVALWRRAQNPLPFTAPGWFIPWWRHLGGGPLRVFTLRRNGRLVGLLPMFIYAEGGVSRLLPLGISVSDAFDMVVEPACSDLAAVLLARAAGATGLGWDRCELHEVPHSSKLNTVAKDAWVQSVSPVLDLHRFMGLPARSATKRRLARAKQAAAGAGLMLDRPGPRALDDLFALHGAQWQAKGQPGMFNTAALQAFHREAAHALHEAGMLRLHRLRDGPRTVAVLYAFRVRDRAYAYLSGVDPGYCSLGLGTLLIGAAIEAAWAEGVQEFDFLRGSEPYKYAWGASDWPLFKLQLEAARPAYSGLQTLKASPMPALHSLAAATGD